MNIRDDADSYSVKKRMLKLRSIGIGDYSVLEGEQRIGRIRFSDERLPGVWLWNVVVHLTAGLRMGSAKDLDTAKADFKAAWENLKARTSKDELAAAYKDMNIRDDDDDKSPDDK